MENENDKQFSWLIATNYIDFVLINKHPVLGGARVGENAGPDHGSAGAASKQTVRQLHLEKEEEVDDNDAWDELSARNTVENMPQWKSSCLLVVLPTRREIYGYSKQ